MEEEESFNDAGPSTSTVSTQSDTSGQPLSKNAMKKAARIARSLAQRPEKRAAERARKREKERYLAQGHEAGTLTPQEEALLKQRRDLRKARKTARKGGDRKEEWGGGVVIDLEFDKLMTDQEITSMVSQLSYVYSENRISSKPIRTVLHTSFSPMISPRLWEKMTKTSWDKWTRSYWWAEGVDVLNQKMLELSSEGVVKTQNPVDKDLKPDMEDITHGMHEEGLPEINTSQSGQASESSNGIMKADEDVKTDQSEGYIPTSERIEQDEQKLPSNKPSQSSASRPELGEHLTGPILPSTLTPSHKLVYLSADAQEELTTLSEDEVYVIGGIVDRNRYKMLCENKAQNLGIRTARLPIGTYLANLPTRKVLTVNQVFQIIAEYITRQDWAEAFEAVIPQRKFQPGKKRRRHGHGVEAGPEGEGDENHGKEELDEEEDDDAEMEASENGIFERDPEEEDAFNA